MSGFDSSRRDFLRRSAAIAASAAATAASLPAFARARQDAPAKPAAAPAPQSKPGKVEVEHRRLGKTDLKVAVLGFGGAEIGYSNTDDATVAKLLNAALDAGLNVLDTAECYVDSEEQIAKAVGHRRKDYFIFTKCGHWTEAGRGNDWTKATLLKSVERSLKRLKTDVIDLVQLHSCSLEELKKGECIEALEQAKKEGKTRFIGYSGDSQAAKFAVESGRFDTLQTSLNIVDQEPIELTLSLAVEEDMGVIIKRTIANAIWRKDKPEGYTASYWNRMKELDYDFLKEANRNNEGPDGPAGVALRFVAQQPGVSVMLVGTTKPERWRQNAELLLAGPLPKAMADSIRDRWTKVAKPNWTGQT